MLRRSRITAPCYHKTKRQSVAGRCRDQEIDEKGVEAKGKAVLSIAHLKPATEWNVDQLTWQLLRQRGEFRLMFGVSAGKDQSDLLVENAEMALTV